MTQDRLAIDVAIIGGGIAGLWALDRLHSAGYSAALFEANALGAGQTMASQGMIHGGMKYALNGIAGADARTISSMPARWRDCLAGIGPVDLRGCEVRSEHVHLWSGGELPGRLAALLASRLLGSVTRKLSGPERPALFQSSDFRGALYALQDFVIDPDSLLRLLANRHRERIFNIDWSHGRLLLESGAAVVQLPDLVVAPRCLLLAAGAGNRDLLGQLGSRQPAMQTRPLAQVLIRHRSGQQLYGHCLGSSVSPRLTVSTHTRADGDTVWYLGGDLATRGATENAGTVIDRARSELAATLPWVDLGDCEWRAVTVHRAEPAQVSHGKPEGAFLDAAASIDNTLVAWPTKLTLAPQLGDRLLARLQAQGLQPEHSSPQPDLAPLEKLGHPDIARPPWEALFT